MTDSDGAVSVYHPPGLLCSRLLPWVPKKLRNMLETLLTWKILAPAAAASLGVFFFYKYCLRRQRNWSGWSLSDFMGACVGKEKRVQPKPKPTRNNPTNHSPGYLGLRNEGSTCYMNSILQCLFMTPDFTNNILRFTNNTLKEHFQGHDQDAYVRLYDNSRIMEAPLSDHVSVFQELFLKLQYGFSPPSTLNLMHCFGIQEGKQQDVEEHFRILINSLPQEIQQLFRIHIAHSLTCSGCTTKEVMQSDMLCLPLAVKGQNPSVDGALRDFHESNKLDLDNQCYCSTCRRKEDAISRHYFTALPKILVVHLKRYEIYQGRFEKITRSVSVPYSLTVPVDKSQEAAAQARRHEVTTTDEEKTSEYPQIDYQAAAQARRHEVTTTDEEKTSEYPQIDYQASAVGTQQVFNTVDQWGRGERKQHKHQANAAGKRKGFNTVDQWGRGERQQHKHQDSVKYTLFARCNHYGGLRGGHYTAEIMSCDNNKWYTFNDTQVMKGSKSKKKEIHSDSAYLLMYYQEQEHPKFLEYDNLTEDFKKRIADISVEQNRTYSFY